MKLLIYQVTREGAGRGLVATVTDRGKVSEEDGDMVQLHVDYLRNDQGLRGKEFIERLQRSWTNGYYTAELKES